MKSAMKTMLMIPIQVPPHGDQSHGGSVASSGKRQKSELLEDRPLTPFFFGAADSRLT